MDPVMQRLVDESAVRDLHLRYCRGVDRLDYDLIESCYHPDATDDHGSFKGDLPGFMQFVRAIMPTLESTSHNTCGQLVEIDGDVAWAENYTIACHRTKATAEEPSVDIILNLRYVDRVERRDGEWRFASRRMALDSETVQPVNQNDPRGFGLPATGRRGDRTDVCYQR